MRQKSVSVNENGKEPNSAQKEQAIGIIISYLQDFGLSEKEAKIFHALSLLGSANSSQITNASQYNRLQTYRAVKGLLDRGLVEISLERPRRYTPLKIEHAISLLEQDAANRMMQLESKKELLLQKWSELKSLSLKQQFTFRIIQGEKNVLKFAIMLYESAQKEINIILKGNEIVRWVIGGVDDSLQRKALNRIIIRAITEFNLNNASAVGRFLQFCDLRHVPLLNTAPLIVIDDKEVLICLNSNNQGIPENAIWTNHPELVGIFSSFFINQWNSAKHGKTTFSELGLELKNNIEF